jgi:uncharacterized protein YdaU (DUF1376 family)
MGKAPADQFYFSDYLRDTRSLSLAARGAWMDCLCEMWFSVIRGRISKPLIHYARYWGCSTDQASAVIDEILHSDVADGGTEQNGYITLINRRMYSAWKDTENNRIRQFRHRAKSKVEEESNADVTPLSSSSSSVFSNIHTPASDDFEYPLKELYEAFPEIQLTPGQAGMIASEVTHSDKEAWQKTLKLYKANNNPATRSYLPEKVGTLLKVFESEKRSLEQKKHGTNKQNGQYGNKPTPANVIANRSYRKPNPE